MKKPSIALSTLARWLFAGALIAITGLAVMPTAAAIISTGWDKANHLLAFLVLMWLLDLAWPAPVKYKLMVLLMYGLAIEIAQTLTPQRVLSGGDLLADAAGMLIYLSVRPWVLLGSERLHQWLFVPAQGEK